MCTYVYFSVLKAETWKKPDETQSCISYGRRRSPVNTNIAEHFLLLTSLWFPHNALFRIAITCHFPLSYTQNQHHTAVSFLSNNRLWRIYRGFTCRWNLSRLTAQKSLRALFMHRTGVWPGSWGELSPPPSHFSRLSFPPLQRFPLGWEGQQLCKNLLPWAVSFRQRRLARSQDGKRLTTAKSTEHVNSFYSYSSLGNQKAKDTLVISLVLWTSTPPRPATHFWFLCSQCPGICSVGNRNREPIAPQLLPIKMCNWISHACFKHHSRRDLQATV